LELITGLGSGEVWEAWTSYQEGKRKIRGKYPGKRKNSPRLLAS